MRRNVVGLSGLPTSLVLNGVIWRVKYFDKMKEVDIDNKDHLFGQIVYEKNEIRILRGKRCKEDIRYTIIHEMIHAFLRYHGGDDPYVKGKDEEKFVNALSAFLVTAAGE